MEDIKKDAPQEEPATVTVPKSLLQDLQDRLSKLESNDGSVVIRKKVKDHTATIRVVGGYVVAEVVKVYIKDKGLPTEKTMCDLSVTKDGDKFSIISKNYLEFLNEADRNMVSILERKEKRRQEVVESVFVSNPDPVHDRRFVGGEQDMVVTYVDYDITFEISDGDLKGKQMTLTNKALNI